MASELCYDEAHGVKAIIALQAMVGIVETEEKAKAGWAGMDAHDRLQTTRAHQVMCGGFEE